MNAFFTNDCVAYSNLRRKPPNGSGYWKHRGQNTEVNDVLTYSFIYSRNRELDGKIGTVSVSRTRVISEAFGCGSVRSAVVILWSDRSAVQLWSRWQLVQSRRDVRVVSVSAGRMRALFAVLGVCALLHSAKLVQSKVSGII